MAGAPQRADHEQALPRSGCESNGGEGEIRTPETLADLHAFQACALGHYATPPAGAYGTASDGKLNSHSRREALWIFLFTL